MHLDGHNQLDYITGATDESPRQHFFYVSDDGDLTALRYDNWKFVFLEQRAPGTLQVWAEPFTELRVPEDLQPAHRPVRTGRHHVEHLLRLDARPCLGGGPGAGVRRSRCSRPSSSSRPGRSRPRFSLEDVLAKLQTGVHST